MILSIYKQNLEHETWRMVEIDWYRFSFRHPLKMSMLFHLLSNLWQELPNFPPEFNKITMQKLGRSARFMLISFCFERGIMMIKMKVFEKIII